MAFCRRCHRKMSPSFVLLSPLSRPRVRGGIALVHGSFPSEKLNCIFLPIKTWDVFAISQTNGTDIIVSTSHHLAFKLPEVKFLIVSAIGARTGKCTISTPSPTDAAGTDTAGFFFPYFQLSNPSKTKPHLFHGSEGLTSRFLANRPPTRRKVRHFVDPSRHVFVTPRHLHNTDLVPLPDSLHLHFR